MPVLILTDFLEQLRLLGWGEKDVDDVASAVLPMISELKDGDTVRLGSVSLAPRPHQIVASGQGTAPGVASAVPSSGDPAPF